MVSSAAASAPAPVPLAMARSMLSLGIEASRAFWTASARAALPSMSPPPSLAATVTARASLVNSLPRRESTIAFLCLIEAHLECPDIRSPVYGRARHAPVLGRARARGRVALRRRPRPPRRGLLARRRGGRRDVRGATRLHRRRRPDRRDRLRRRAGHARAGGAGRIRHRD